MAQAASSRTRKVPAMGPGRWAAFAEVAQGLPTPDSQTELHGTVIHRDSLLPLAMACTLGCAVTVLGVFFPQTGLALLTALALGVGIDAMGGNSWVRRLTPLAIGRTVLCWPTGGHTLHDPRPAILICLESGRSPGFESRAMFGYTLLALGVALAGTTVHAMHPDIPLPTQRWGAAALAFGPVLAFILSPIARRRCWLQSSTKVAHALCSALTQATGLTHRVAIALVDQSPLHGDGLSALLQTQQLRLPTRSTTIVAWSRGEDEFAWTRPLSLQSIGPLRQPCGVPGVDLPTHWGISSASVALRAGRVAYGLTGGENPNEVCDQLISIVRALETQARVR